MPIAIVFPGSSTGPEDELKARIDQLVRGIPCASVTAWHEGRFGRTGNAHQRQGMMGYFASVYSLLAPAFELVMRPLREQQSGAASGQTLVIGAGTGLDVAPLLDRGITPDLLEPDPTLAAGLRRRYPGLQVWEAAAEDIPAPDERYDTVLATLVLCSVSRPRDVLREVERVLKPGGRFLFTEHVVHEDGHIGRYLQQGLEPVWRPLAGGCRLTRHPACYVDATDLVIDHLEPVRQGLLLPIVQGAFYKAGA